jgi:hypothetical protein
MAVLYRGARFDGPQGRRLIGVAHHAAQTCLRGSGALAQYAAEAEQIAHLGSFDCIAGAGQTVWSEEAYRI